MHAPPCAGRVAAAGTGKSQHWLYVSGKLKTENKKGGGRRQRGGSKLTLTCAFCLGQVPAAQYDYCSHGHTRAEADKTPLSVWLPG